LILPDDLREIDEHIYQIECLIGRVAAIAAARSAAGNRDQAKRARGTLSDGSDVLAVLRDLRHQLLRKRAHHEAPINAELARLFEPPPDLAG
jgi:hypothetical protein